MSQRPLRTYILIIADLLLLLVCALHIPALLERPRVPFSASSREGTVVVHEILDSEAAGDIRQGDTIIRLAGHPITRPEILDYITDFSAIHASHPASVSRAGQSLPADVRLIPYYSTPYCIIVGFIALITFLLALYLGLKGPGDLTATTLQGSFMSLAVVVIMAWEGISTQASLPFLGSALFFLSYTGVATLFFFFTTLFPRPKPGFIRLKGLLTFLPALAVVIPTITTNAYAYQRLALPAFDTFMWWFDIFYFMTFVYIGGGIFNFVHSYATSTFSAERKRVKWILFGLCAGPTPFVLSVLYTRITGETIVPEIYTLPFLLIIPMTFIVSFLKYHILDIEVVINRTTVYGIVISLLVGVYAVFIGLVGAIVGVRTPGWSAVAAVAVALLFEPARKRVQQFVDRRFFRVQFDFRETQRALVDEIKHCLDLQRLATLMVERSVSLIPVERIGFFIIKQPGNRLLPLAHHHFDLLEHHGIRFESEHLRSALQLPVGLHDRIEPGVRFEAADERVFHRWEMALVFPVMSGNGESLGFLVLGGKKSGTRFSAEEVDLLTTVTAQAGLAMERIALQRQLLLKEEEAQRLAEMNRMKSEFVSYVSHEFRTPLTSIKMFAELLQTKLPPRDKLTKEYLGIISGESDRLDRMVGTILDVARIESGVKEFHFEDMDLRTIVQHVMDTMSYQLRKSNFNVSFTTPQKPICIYADPDAVGQAVINLVSNAIKYSGETKILKVSIGRRNGHAFCRVQDRGVGISGEALEHIFERFYREPGIGTKVQGVGLGLPLVKHIMEVHGGRIEVQSTVGRGSTFSLFFPKGNARK